MAVKNAISCQLLQDLWQPFNAEGLLTSSDTTSECVRLLHNLSEQLSSRHDRSEAVWRSYSHWALDRLVQGRTPDLRAVSSTMLVDKLYALLAPLAQKLDEPSLQTDLRALVEQAMELWKGAQRDHHRIQVIWPQKKDLDREGWLDEVDEALGEIEIPTEALALVKEVSVAGHCTFPRVVSHQSHGDLQRTVEVYKGRMLWADSKAVALGLCAYQRVQEGWDDLKRHHQTMLAKVGRRASIATNGSSGPFRAVEHT